jgi:hypothetical protein
VSTGCGKKCPGDAKLIFQQLAAEPGELAIAGDMAIAYGFSHILMLTSGQMGSVERD